MIWNRWLSWDEARTGETPADAITISDPWIYDETRPASGTIHHIGSYWYRFAPLHPGSYQVALDFVNHGYSAWLWNTAEPERKISFSVGREGKDASTELASAVKRIVSFESHASGDWILVINFSYWGRETGGLWSPPRLAPGHSLGQEKFVHLSLVFATCGSLVIMMLYMTMMFVRRHDDTPSLFLAMLCLGIVMRVIGVEMILCEIFDPAETSLVYNVSRRLEYFSVGFITVAYLNFVTTTFGAVRHPKRLVQLINVLCVAYMLDCCVVSMDALRHHVHFMQILTLISLILTVGFLVLCVRHKEEGSVYMLAASIVPFAVLIFEIVISRMGSGIRIGHFAGTFFIFLQSQLLARRFAGAFNRAAHLSQELQSEVARQTSQIRHIMDHIPEGLFVIDNKKTITPPYSRFLGEILPEHEMASEGITRIFSHQFKMSTHDVAMLDSILEASLNEDAINWEFNREHMAEMILRRDDRSYRMHWHPIVSEGRIVQFMGIIHDISELMQLEAAARERQEDVQILGEFIHTPRDMMNGFLQKQTRLMDMMMVEQRKPQTLASLQAIFAYLHTLKGNARQLHFKELAHLCHETESPFRAALASSQLLDSTELETLLRRLEAKLARYCQVFEQFFSHEPDSAFSHFTRSESALLRSWLEGKPSLPDQVRELIQMKLGWGLKDWIEKLGREQLALAPQLGKAIPALIVHSESHLDCANELRDALLDALGT